MKRKKVYLNGRFLTQPISGVQRYAWNMILALDRQVQNDFEFILLCPKGAREFPLKKISIKKCGFLNGHFWEQIELPFIAGIDLLINLCNTGPLIKRNQIVAIHDAAVFSYPEAYSRTFVLWYKLSGYLLTLFSKRIITVSKFSQSEITKIFKIDKMKTNILSPGIGFDYISEDSIILDRLQLKDKKYFLCVSSLDIKKNFKGVIKAFNVLKSKGISNVSLVIAGSLNNSVFKQFDLPNFNDIIFTGYLTDSELVTLYKNSIAFVYPSFYEGFGLPPLEAMSLGVPVIVSNVASLPEVCADKAIYCDPFDIDSIVSAMQIVLENGMLIDELKESGPKHAALFSYERSANELNALLYILLFRC